MSEIGQQFGITKQAVSKALKGIESRVQKALAETARAAKIDVYHVDPGLGVLLGFSRERREKVIVTFTAKNGVHIWHFHSDSCRGCEYQDDCRRLLIDEAAERNVQLSSEEKDEPPSALARTVFSKVLPGVEP